MGKMGRRSFITKAGKGAAVLAAAGPFIRSGFAGDSPNDRIKVAVVGIRSRGKEHLSGLAKIPNVEVSVICDDPEMGLLLVRWSALARR